MYLDVYVMGNKSQRPTAHLLDMGTAVQRARFGQCWPVGIRGRVAQAELSSCHLSLKCMIWHLKTSRRVWIKSVF